VNLPTQVWDALTGVAGVSSGAFASASCRAEVPEETLTSVGLLHGHAYTILHAVQTQAGLQLVNMKNPWGSCVRVWVEIMGLVMIRTD
jgi:uncharacterized membrane protein YgdD (TMEM256/DUF423 family)